MKEKFTITCPVFDGDKGKKDGRTVKKYVDGLQEKRLIETQYTTVQTKDGHVHNGTLEYTILPLNIAEEYYDAKQMKRLVQEQARANIFKKLAKFDKKRERPKG